MAINSKSRTLNIVRVVSRTIPRMVGGLKMLCHSKIEVWYKVSGERILLGETCCSKTCDVISMWVDLPFDLGSSSNQGYGVSLFDDDGRCIGDKSVLQIHAERVLTTAVTTDMFQSVNHFCFPRGNSDQADLALI